MVFARWDPFRDLVSDPASASSGLAVQGRKAGRPPWICARRHGSFIFTAELPGLTRDQIRIDVHDNRLTLQGRREARVSCDQYHQVERGHGEFCRTFLLPHAVMADGVNADLTDGVLTVTVPKSPADAPRRVVVA